MQRSLKTNQYNIVFTLHNIEEKNPKSKLTTMTISIMLSNNRQQKHGHETSSAENSMYRIESNEKEVLVEIKKHKFHKKMVIFESWWWLVDSYFQFLY